MRRSSQTAKVLQVGGFALHYHLGRLIHVGFVGQCCVIAAASAVAVLVASYIDRSLILKTPNVGLLQHPSFWAFIGLQVGLPLAIRHSLGKLVSARESLRDIVDLDGTPDDLLVSPLLRFLQLRDNSSRLVATVLYCCGFAAFVWNTYQNQLPNIVVPFDFWDSKSFAWSFWTTRVYRLYLFVWLLPYLALSQIGIMVVVLRLIRRARLSGRLKLLPFHPDGLGGFGFVPGLVTTPIMVTALMASIPTAAVFEIHRALDVTPLIGLSVIVVAIVIAYIIPLAVLRRDIIAIKSQITHRLGVLQQSYYTLLTVTEDPDFETLKRSNEALDYFEKIRARIKAISNYPHFGRLVGYIGIVLTPSVLSITFKVFSDLLPFIRPLLRHA